MTTTITITKNTDNGFKTVVVVCYDKRCGKYRSVNLGSREIAPHFYESPQELIDELQRLKDKGIIKDFEVITR